MEPYNKFKTEALELLIKAQKKYTIYMNELEEDVLFLRETENRYSALSGSLSQAMMQQTELIESILLSAKENDLLKASQLLKHLDVCFSEPGTTLMESMAKMRRQQLVESRQVLIDHLTVKNGEVGEVTDILSNHMNTTSINIKSVPQNEKCGAVNWKDIKERDEFLCNLQRLAPVCPVPNEIYRDQIYAVFSKDRKWCRAQVKHALGIAQVCDGSFEVTYNCFLLDVSQYEHIYKRDIRMLPVLPGSLAGLSSSTTTRLIPQSRMDDDDVGSIGLFTIAHNVSQGVTLSKESTKKVTVRAPNVILPSPGLKNPQKDVQHQHQLQDISLLDTSSATSAIAPLSSSSISDHSADLPSPIVILTRPEGAVKKYKPKFSQLELQLNPLKYAQVVIVKAFHPRAIYVQIKDADSPRYLQLHKDLQEEFRGATCRSTTYCRSPKIGHPYALRLGTQWFRVQIKTFKSVLKTVLVDTGHCLSITSEMMFHYLPNRFLKLPVQAVKCSLQGVNHPSSMNADGSWDVSPEFPPQVSHFMSKYNGKEAVAFFNIWMASEEGESGNPGSHRELLGVATLYLDGERDSINLQIGQTGMVYLGNNIEKPEHLQIRIQLAGQKLKEQIFLKEETICARNPILNREELALVVPAFFVGCTSPNAIYLRTPGLAERFIKMHIKLRSYFEAQLIDLNEAPITLFVGFIGALKYGDQWFRVKVVDVEKYPDVTVLLFDIALSFNVSAREIRHLPDELKTNPKTLLCFSFSGVRPSSGTVWGPKATQYVSDQLNRAERITIGYRKDAKSLSTGNAIPVAVYVHEKRIPNLKPGITVDINMSNELVSLGLAAPTDYH